MVAIGAGGLKVEGFEAEWAEPTYKLGRLLIIFVVIMMSYPYLPGSGSDVFKGFSLFVGALVTLGASSSIANVIAGIILTYTGSFRVGDRVKIGDTVGDVTEKRLFVTRLRTIYNEEVTVPNGIVMQTQIINYTTSSQKGGLALTIEAGIGYDVDWRTVHELLKKAAGKTEQHSGRAGAVRVAERARRFRRSIQARRVHRRGPGRGQDRVRAPAARPG